jgi:cobalt-zinc-cadmium efflux system protein
LNAALILALVTVGLFAHSVSVLAAAGDTLGDCLGLVIGLIAVSLRDRNPDHPHAQRPIAIAALVNACLLIIVAVSVVVESIVRLAEGIPTVYGLPVVVVSVITVVVMLVGASVLGFAASDEDIHMRSVLLDALADAAAAAGVTIAGAIILISGGLYWLDPVLALAISAFIGIAAARLGLKAIGALRGRAAEFHDN